MIFLTAKMQAAWERAHPELKEALGWLETRSLELGAGELVITDLDRTPADQERIYLAYFLRLLAEDKAGRLNGPKLEEAKPLRGLREEQLRARARGRFSWHLSSSAADVRTRTMPPKARVALVNLAKSRLPFPAWEVLAHDVAGDHLHIGRRDARWHRAFLSPVVS